MRFYGHRFREAPPQSAAELGRTERHFLRTLQRYNGRATPSELCDLTTDADRKARENCKRLGLAHYESGRWWLTEDGKVAVLRTAKHPAPPKSSTHNTAVA